MRSAKGKSMSNGYGKNIDKKQHYWYFELQISEAVSKYSHYNNILFTYPSTY